MKCLPDRRRLWRLDMDENQHFVVFDVFEKVYAKAHSMSEIDFA